ncbi:hypothetical protein [Mycolicibacterium mageritense]|uniref:hypothetical protein n=1 Tax=Mycolicibacterium mageritense TaxID=53462 RepID=UPI001E4C2312|nr:hypothetical protein [Mycolicibacterium mageritense]MCC9182572.1 hypothetical protein [Mycolicibacterium mageritense]
MPRYRTETGVVVDVPQEKAQRIGGLTPADAPTPSPRPGPKKAGHKTTPAPEGGGH